MDLYAGMRLTVHWWPGSNQAAEVLAPGALSDGQGFTVDGTNGRWRGVLAGHAVGEDGGLDLDLEIADRTPVSYGPVTSPVAVRLAR